jgi:hypothetical protein
MKLIITIYKERRICLDKYLYLQSLNDDAYHRRLILIIPVNARGYSVAFLHRPQGRAMLYVLMMKTQ